MKYKAKFNLASKYYRKDYKMPCTDTILKESEYNSEDFGSDQGVFVFIPFTDQRFFEPVKVRTFQVEVSEDDIEHFNYVKQDFNWTVTEQTLPYWVVEFKAQNPGVTIDSYEGIDPVWVKNNFISRKWEALKWIKTHTDCGIISAKRLTDYIWEMF